MIDPVYVLSLGAGVQSSTAALKIAAGEILPMVNSAIFSDTQAEPKSVYTWLDWLEQQLPFPVHRVTAGNLETDALRERERKDGKGTWVPSGIPHYSINSDGSLGHGPRQCTHDFKVLPIHKKQRELVGHQPMVEWRRRHKAALAEFSKWEKLMVLWKRAKRLGEKVPTPPLRPDDAWKECQSEPLCITMVGMSSDESSRLKESRVPWIKLVYPLYDQGITRKACLDWMQKRGFPKPPRSACVFCPYHSDEEWRRLRDEEPDEFARAVRFDNAYRAAKIRTVKHKGFVPFLHDSRKPLSEINFDAPTHEQAEFDMFNNECEGMCGV